MANGDSRLVIASDSEAIFLDTNRLLRRFSSQ